VPIMAAWCRARGVLIIGAVATAAIAEEVLKNAVGRTAHPRSEIDEESVIEFSKEHFPGIHRAGVSADKRF